MDDESFNRKKQFGSPRQFNGIDMGGLLVKTPPCIGLSHSPPCPRPAGRRSGPGESQTPWQIGTDMSQFPSTADLDSWAGMAPGNNQSGGKRHRAKARKGNRWLRTMLVESGNAAGRTRNTALSALYRRMIVRGGRKHAAFVVGRHILNIAYHLLRERTTYRELGPTYFEQRRAEQLKRRCLDQLRNLGFAANLVPLPKAA
jgi:transposase